ncbi:unnamed protein product [Ceutorhynchus assimilis]|uniref:Uncharacterized protein n=1 Tax=Ceutorhynchus assimilis TaxID=467358 RepID=A0A9N9MQ58_9CUCU|nr:unnamed protein product [Ceutorhynchus assimilis]
MRRPSEKKAKPLHELFPAADEPTIYLRYFCSPSRGAAVPFTQSLLLAVLYPRTQVGLYNSTPLDRPRSLNISWQNCCLLFVKAKRNSTDQPTNAAIVKFRIGIKKHWLPVR